MTAPERRFFITVYRLLGPEPGVCSTAAVAVAEERLGVDAAIAVQWMKAWEESGWWARPDRLSLLRGGCFTPRGVREVGYQAAVEVKGWKKQGVQDAATDAS